MKTFFLIVFTVFFPLHLSANPFPALYNVTGVASDDVLNVRAAPHAGAEKIGALSYAQTQIEVVSTSDDHTWGLVNIGEGAGWVSMAYLQRLPGQEWGSFNMPAGCYGTEPFWSVTGMQGDQIILEETSDTPFTYHLIASMSSIGNISSHWLVGENGGRNIHITFRRTSCHDGMSDREYGLAVDLYADTDDNGPLALTGCCLLAPQ